MRRYTNLRLPLPLPLQRIRGSATMRSESCDTDKTLLTVNMQYVM